MYFSNIHNQELQHFHSTIGADFTMSLTDILNSDLFEIENISNNIYRVFPLFYCKQIISSNSNDRILDNRCLILTQKEHETYVSFMTNKDKSNVILDGSLFNIKTLEDYQLSMDEFNAMVYMLRKNELNGTVSFEDTVLFEGSYATYELCNQDDKTRNDAGFIVTSEMKRNPLTVKLINPFFLSAKYTLKCTVKSITGANVCDNDDTDFKTVDTFNVLLVENQEVTLNVSEYSNDSILLFDTGVSISFDVPEIVNSEFSLNLQSDKQEVLFSDSFNLTAILSGRDNVSGYLVGFYEDGVLIGTETTDNLGGCGLKYTPTGVGAHRYEATCLGLKEGVNVKCIKYSSSITIESDKRDIIILDSFTVRGVLSNTEGALSNTSVKIYDNNTVIAEVTTDENGIFNHTITANTSRAYNIYAVYEGDDYNYRSQSNLIPILCEYCLELAVTGPSFSSYNSKPFTYTGIVRVDWGDGTFENYNGEKLIHNFRDGLANHTVRIYGNITSLAFRCFYQCTGLTSVIIQKSVTNLGEWDIFEACTNLTSITFSDNVTSIGPRCFEKCTSLTIVTFNWKKDPVPYISASWFSGTTIPTLRIPAGTRQLYIDAGYPSDKLVER